MKKNKYELTDKTIEFDGHILHRIIALKDFGSVTKGDLGGFIEKEENLSQEGDCWVYNDAKVYGNVRVYDYVQVYGNAQVYRNAIIHGEAKVYGNAKIYDAAVVRGDAEVKELSDYIVFKNNWSSGRYFTWTKSNDMWRVGCFYGTGKELIEKAYKDSEESGKNYEKCVKFAEDLNN